MPSFVRLAAAFAAGLLQVSTFAQSNVDVYLTAKDTPHRLARTETLALAPAGVRTEKEHSVFVDAGRAFQTVLGIGGALTDASAETYAKLPAPKQQEVMRAYFDPKDGIGYTLGRTHIHSCDFSSASYTYVADNDEALRSFSVAPDERFRIPFTKAAIAAAGGKLTLFASPWSPPAWMKDNNHMLRGGKLLPKYRDAWARYFVAFIRAYEERGMPIWGVTVQNEPMAVQRWESCVFTAEEERDFVRDHLGPVFERNGLGDRKIVIWDHNRTWMYQRAQVALTDPAAAKYIWGVGFHWYMDDAFANVARVREAFPETNLLFTEGCNYPYDRAKLGEWQWGENYGRSMIHDFNNGVVGWTDWNILLDEHGGPNHVKNFCYAPLHADTQTGELMYMNSYYYIGHFSKFVRPGARRIISSSTADALLTTAFKNTDGSLAVVIMNATEKPQPFKLSLGNQSVSTTSPARSMMTLVVK